MTEMTEAPLTTTLKAPGANAPWVVLRSANSTQLAQQLAELQSNTTFADLARANEAFAAHFNMGAILGARSVAAPVDTGAFTPAPQAAAPQPQYAAPPQQQYTEQYPPVQQQYQQAPVTPGAPLVNGQPAKLVSGSKNGRQWQAWADPRPKEATEGMQRTDDPNHPGLGSGTHSLWKFIR